MARHRARRSVDRRSNPSTMAKASTVSKHRDAAELIGDGYGNPMPLGLAHRCKLRAIDIRASRHFIHVSLTAILKAQTRAIAAVQTLEDDMHSALRPMLRPLAALRPALFATTVLFGLGAVTLGTAGPIPGTASST